MQAMFTEFKCRLRVLRRIAEAMPEFDMADIRCVLNAADFNDRVILYRLDEYEEEQPFTRQSLLRFLSLWECSL